MSQANVRSVAPEVRVLAAICFWLFAGTGTAIFSAWVLIPEYFDYVAVMDDTLASRRDVARLEVRNQLHQEHLEALERDPQFLARQLKSRQTRGSATAGALVDEQPEVRLPDPTPEALAAQEKRIPGTRRLELDLPDRWTSLFMDTGRRPVLMAIAIGCLTIAFVFFVPES